MIENADVAVCVAKGDKVFSEQFSRTGAPSDSSSLESNAGIQYRRINVPIGVPGPICVKISPTLTGFPCDCSTLYSNTRA
jgi:hypothetical protein